MKFTPITEQEAEAQSSSIWPDGTYDFEVKEAEEKTSQAGNEMTELQVWIFNKEGDRKMVFDYLVSSEKASWKIRHFAASCGLIRQYETGSLLAPEIVGRTGQCTIGTQKARDSYPAKNVIRDYVKTAGSTAHTGVSAPAAGRREKAPAGDIDDEIPF
jgi:hypothetical protein